MRMLHWPLRFPCSRSSWLPGSAARSLKLLAPEAERRQVTVTGCDLVGPTKLSVRLDFEDLSEIIRAYHSLASQRGDRIEQDAAMSDRRHADVFEVFGGQLRQNCFIARVLAECRLVRCETKAPQPTFEVHERHPNLASTEGAQPDLSEPWLGKGKDGPNRLLTPVQGRPKCLRFPSPRRSP